MADKFDPYREALVVETVTIWPEEIEIDPRQRFQFEALLHANAQEATHLVYERVHTGFRRIIHVTDDDLARVSPSVA